MNEKFYVVPREGRWAIETAGGRLIGLGYATQEEAFKVAQGIAGRGGSAIVLNPSSERVPQLAV